MVKILVTPLITEATDVKPNTLFLSVVQSHKGMATHAHTLRTMNTVALGPDGATFPPMKMLHKWIEPRDRGLHAYFTKLQWCMGCFLWKKEKERRRGRTYLVLEPREADTYSFK